MCDFCENSRCVAERQIAYGYSMQKRDLILSNRRVMSISFESANPLDTKFKDIDLKIRFCPNCGRELRSEENE